MTPRARKEQKGSKQGTFGQSAKQARRTPTEQGAGHVGLTSGQAARYCLVSSDTIANWISAGQLRAQRTAGGQYRIRIEDLRAFMKAHGMRTDLLDSEVEHSPACWEFWAALSKSTLVDGVSGTCSDCPVYRSRAKVCHEVRPLLPGGTLRAQSCADCHYLSTFMEGAIEER
jgi:excisionase family DNA binding protein